MNHAFGNTSLRVTAVLLHQSQTSLLRDTYGEQLILCAVEDEKTGEKGHVLYLMATDGRDIDEEQSYTDNPKLFQSEHPQADGLIDLLRLASDTTPKESTAETRAVMEACYEHRLSYKDGPDGWGMYAGPNDDEDADADD